MKNVLKIFALVALACVTLFTLVACGEKEGPADTGSIVGYWQTELAGYDFIYSFNEDGTGYYNAAGTVMPFTYAIEGDNLSILYDGDTEPFDTKYELKGNVLNVKDSSDKDTLYQRTTEDKVPVVNNVPKEEQIGTAGSNIPLKDNHDEAEHQVKVAFQRHLEETYGEKVADAKIYVEKIYTAEEEEEIPALKDMELHAEEVAFEVRYEIKPAEGVDPIEFTVANGEYDEETGWVKEKYNCGVLRPAIVGEADYRITDLGTGW